MSSASGIGLGVRYGGNGRRPSPGRFSSSGDVRQHRYDSPFLPLSGPQGLQLRRMPPFPWFADLRPAEWNAMPKLLN